jgi:hypothetical protein
MAGKRFGLRARVSTDNPAAVEPVLRRLIASGSIEPGEKSGEFYIEAELEGSSARDLNRWLLSELRRAEKRTRIRSEWSAGGRTERFFDYVPKGRGRT